MLDIPRAHPNSAPQNVKRVSALYASFNAPAHPRYWSRVLCSETLEVVLLVISLLSDDNDNNVALGIILSALVLQSLQLPFIAFHGYNQKMGWEASLRAFSEHAEEDGTITPDNASLLRDSYIDPRTGKSGWVQVRRASESRKSLAYGLLPRKLMRTLDIRAWLGMARHTPAETSTNLTFEELVFPHERPTFKTTMLHLWELAADWLTFTASLLLFEVGKKQPWSTHLQGILAIVSIVAVLKSVLTGYLDKYEAPFGPLRWCLVLSLFATYGLLLIILVIGYSAGSAIYERGVFIAESSTVAGLESSDATGLIVAGILTGIALFFLIGWYLTFRILVCGGCLRVKYNYMSKKQQSKFDAKHGKVTAPSSG